MSRKPLFTRAPYVPAKRIPLRAFIFTRVCGCTRSPFAQINTPTHKRNHMHRLTRFMTFERGKKKGGQFGFYHQKRKSTGGENRARWTHGAEGSDGRRRARHQIKAKRLQGSGWQPGRTDPPRPLFLSRSLVADNPVTFAERCLTSLIKH